MVDVIEQWERRIIATERAIAPDISEEKLAKFRGQVSNLDNVWEFMERWAEEEGDVEEGLMLHSIWS